jgi:hypothetical protein
VWESGERGRAWRVGEGGEMGELARQRGRGVCVMERESGREGEREGEWE